MAKRKASLRRSFQTGRQDARKLKHVQGLDPTLKSALGGLRVEGVKDLQLAMLQKVLERMVQIRLAQWMEAVLLTLGKDFGFNEEQLAQFARSFMERSRGQAETTAKSE